MYFIFSKNKNKIDRNMQRHVNTRVSHTDFLQKPPVSSKIFTHYSRSLPMPPACLCTPDRCPTMLQHAFNTYKCSPPPWLYIATLGCLLSRRVVVSVFRQKIVSEGPPTNRRRHVIELVPESHALRSRL